MSKLKELREKQQKLVAEAREFLDEIEKDGIDESRAKELEASYDKAMASHDALEEKVQRELQLQRAEQQAADVADALPENRRRPQGDGCEGEGGGRTVDLTEEQRMQVFRRVCQFGVSGLVGEDRQLFQDMHANLSAEMRAQTTSTTGGGYTIPEGFLPEITKSMAMWGPMLDPGVTRVIDTATGNDLPWPTMDDTSNEGEIIAENTQHNEQDITFGQKTLGAYLYSSKIIRVPVQLLQDSAFNVDSEIIVPAFGERIGRIANRHLTTGTGTGQPNGIVTASGLGVTADGASTIDFDDLIDLEHSVDPAYRMAPSCRFMFNDTTLKVLRKLKDGDSNYIWQPADARSGAPATLLNHPYTINQAMASIGGSTKPVIFGDMQKYITRRVKEFTMVRMQERYADYLQVGFLAFNRIDGELADTAAVKHLVMQSG